MASMILYKFRSGTTFEALPLPGSAARLFDVKKAIIQAKKLDAQSAMDFDLVVRNADTNEAYSVANESMLLPRGTRLIVQRMPAPRGHGFLARMARGGGQPEPAQTQQQSAVAYESQEATSSNFAATSAMDDDNELAALQAVTSLRPTEGPVMTGSAFPGRGRGGGGGGGFKPNNAAFRPSADPEIREQEKKLMPKKRATGIPRTFLNLSAPPQTDGAKEGEEGSNVPLLQPNTLGFKELVSRGGGLSETTAGTRRDLDYALKLTSTEIPENLQCAICQSVVKNAMLLPWDPEKRSTCETCIRDSLAQNGFRCPLTGIEGVSPDDLQPDYPLRKAADQFIKEVMEKIDEIEKQQVEETAPPEDDEAEQPSTTTMENILDGDGAERGVIISKRAAAARKKEEEDQFGAGEDPFGGDVFAVETDKPEEEEAEANKESNDVKEEGEDTSDDPPKPLDAKDNSKAKTEATAPAVEKESTPSPAKPLPQPQPQPQSTKQAGQSDDNPDQLNRKGSFDGHSNDTDRQRASEQTNHRRERRRRGPPVGYAMGPAGGAVTSAIAHPSQMDERGYGRGGRGRTFGNPPNSANGSSRWGSGRGRYADRDRGYGSNNLGGSSHQNPNDDQESRGTKRSWNDQQSDGGASGAPPPPPPPPPPEVVVGGGYNDRRGGHRGGWRGGGYRGGRGGGGGRGGYGRGGYGRGRY